MVTQREQPFDRLRTGKLLPYTGEPVLACYQPENVHTLTGVVRLQ